MSMEQQVCAIEYSKRLNELGCNKNSYFVWAYIVDYYELHKNPTISGFDLEATAHLTFAYTVAELGEMLPEGLFSCKLGVNGGWTMYSDGMPWLKPCIPAFQSNTEADCRAKALIWCLENGVIKI